MTGLPGPDRVEPDGRSSLASRRGHSWRIATQGWVAVAGPGDDVVVASRTNLVGRLPELAALESAARRSADGTPTMLVLEGAMGVGKSRLAEETLRIARRLDFVVCASQCWENFEVPYLGIGPKLFPEVAERLADEPAYREDLRALRRVDRSDLDEHPLHAEDLVLLEHDASANQVDRLLGVLTVAAARTGPLALIIDDVQWADCSSWRFLESLARLTAAAAEPSQLLVVLAGRDLADVERAKTLLDTPEVVRLDIRTLGALESFELAQSLTPGSAGKRSTATAIAAASSGNPLYITTLAREIASSRHRDTAGPGETDSTLDLPLTGGLADAITRRLDGLSAEAAHTLAVVSFLGAFATTSVVCSITGTDDADVEAHLQEAVELGVILIDRDRVSFAHPLYRHACYTSLATITRKRIHVRIAEELLDRAPVLERDDVLPAVAHHLMTAGLVAPAELVIEHCRPAGDLSAGARAWGDAARCYEAVLVGLARLGDTDAAGRAEVRLLAAAARMLHLDLDDARRHAVTSAREYAELGDPRSRAHALLIVHRCDIMHGHFGRSLDIDQLADIVVAASGEGDPRLAARALIDISERHWMAGDFDDGLFAARQAAHLAEQGGAGDLTCAALVSQATCHWLRLDLAESARALDAAEQLGDDHEPGIVALGRLSLNSWWMGDRSRAVIAARRADELAQAAGLPAERIAPLCVLAADAMATGDFTAGERLAESALVIQRVSGDQWFGAFLYPLIAGSRLMRGRWDEASSAFSTWTSELDQRGGGVEHEFVQQCKRWAQAWRGSTPDGIDPPRRAVTRRAIGRRPPVEAQPRDLMLGMGSYTAVGIEIADLSGQPNAVAALALHAELDACHARGELVTSSGAMLVPRVLATAARLAGRADLALTHIDDAADAAQRLGFDIEGARTRVEAARLHLDLGVGDEADARANLVAALEVFSEHGLDTLVDRTAAWLGQMAAPGRVDHAPRSWNANTQ
jgi:hypothetical protein